MTPTARMLWLTVILNAVQDFRAGKEPREYFDSRDFLFLCDLAGLEPRDIRRTL